MQRKKLSLDKLVLGSLSEDEQAKVFGGNDIGSVAYITTICLGPGTNVPATSFVSCPNPSPSVSRGATLIACVSTVQY